MKSKIGLALSGGGYRAAAFHLGTFRKLKELGILDQVDVISTISGGSIAGAFYCLNKDNFQSFDDQLVNALQKSTIKRILISWSILLQLLMFLFVLILYFGLCFNIDFWATDFGFCFESNNWYKLFALLYLFIFLIFHFKFISLTNLKIKAYNKIFFKGKMLCCLPDKPELVMNATNLSTGTLFSFSKRKSSDSSYLEARKSSGLEEIEFNCNNMPIAKVVASSTCVPFAFDPVKIERHFFVNPEHFELVSPRLIDGGIYDNQGIHKITQKNSSYYCSNIIVSDGSQPFEFTFSGYNIGSVFYRSVDLMMRRIKTMQFIRDVYSDKTNVAYYSLNFEYTGMVNGFVNAVLNRNLTKDVLDSHGYQSGQIIDPECVKAKIGYYSIVSNGLLESEVIEISKIGTNLTSLRPEQIASLSRHASVLTEISVRLYLPHLITEQLTV
ncbi:MAG: patatin-like phospholipase family protein [Saprospiraceae bacterium]|nr:patatin-like phospholipase family protein [Saprospiraceae bacterium]